MPENRPTAATRNLIGYWHEMREPPYSHPQPLVDLGWEVARRHRIVEYLKLGHVYAYSLGHSYCRFGCTQPYLTRVDDPSKGEYREMTRSYRVITDGEEKTVVEDASGYYATHLGPMANGSRACCDDVWCWPQGLAHYVETHGIRLPDEFVAHAAARQFQAGPRVTTPINEDDRFWLAWCRTNAPFEYETHCLACNPEPR